MYMGMNPQLVNFFPIVLEWVENQHYSIFLSFFFCFEFVNYALQALMLMLTGIMLEMSRECWSVLGKDLNTKKFFHIVWRQSFGAYRLVTFIYRGKNFVIKYEGCFKNGNTDCSVLEHVEHDRPEVIIVIFK